MATIQLLETRLMPLSALIGMATLAMGKPKFILSIAVATFFITCQSHQTAVTDTVHQPPH